MASQKILASSIYIYPSQNANDGGEINNESNLSSVSKKLFDKNFVIKSNLYSEPFMITVGTTPGTIVVSPGECCIDGKYVHMSQSTTASVTESGDVFIRLVKDLSGMVQGDVINVDDHQIYCNGAEIYVGSTPQDNLYVRLGSVDVDGGSITVSVNQDKYYFIDVSLIKDYTNNQTLVQYVLDNVMNELDLPEKNQYTAITIAEVGPNASRTYNGQSDSLARADHTHDARYVHKVNSSSAQYTSEQTVYTPLRVKKDLAVEGSITASGTITGSKVYNAVWNDYAELRKKDDPHEFIDAGMIVAKVPGKLTYSVAKKDSKIIAGVCSNTYGVLLGGDKDKSEEENLKKYVPVAIAGLVRVKVADNSIKEGDYIKVADYGFATRASIIDRVFKRNTIIGRSLEDSEGKTKVLMQVIPQ